MKCKLSPPHPKGTMASLPHPCSSVSPNLSAALLLCALSLLRAMRLPCPSVDQVLAATGAKRSRAYELKDALWGLLPTLERPAGRPRTESSPPLPDTCSITGQVLDFIMQHPGCVQHCGQRRHYSDTFRRFLLGLAERNRELPLESLAQAAHIPPGTLKDWLRGGNRDTAPLPRSTVASPDPLASARVQTIVAEYRLWHGSFSVFCDHVSFNLRIPFGRSLVASILEQHGERTPPRRSGRSADERALRQAFETFFAGAQWVGDGKAVDVWIDEQRFRFNLELMVDTDSAAVVGASTREEEDAQAVTDAFDDGVQTTGEPPLATLLDNRPSNHTDQVKQHLEPSMTMHATKGRPQNKAHVEGAFGLFAQVVPLLVITTTTTPKELALQVVQLVVQTWGRTLNHKTRKDRKGRSRVESYTSASPTPEQVEQARAALEQRLEQQDKARQTLQARQNPVVRSLLDEAFARLELLDPTGNIRASIARYPLDAVLGGIATFEGKQNASTLPDGVDGRYLLGIVRNISQQDEALQTTEALLRLRLDAQDRLLVPLRRSLHELLQLDTDPVDTIKALTDSAFKADRQLDRLFWLGAAADHIRAQPDSSHSHLLRIASRRIHACFAARYRDRQDALRFICNRLFPLG